MLLFLCNCSTNSQKNTNISVNGKCVENLTFKDEYFKNVKIIEDYMKLQRGEPKNAYNALKFISKYSKVSFEDMANYARTYPLGTFEKDYPNWLEWYKKNKCNNIQFKK